MTDFLPLIESFYKSYFTSQDIIRLMSILSFGVVSTFIVLLSHISIYKLFKVDLLKVKDNVFPNWLYYLVGSVATYLLLYSLNLISYNVQTIIVVAFTWRILLKNVVDNLTSKSGNEKIIDEIDEALPMYSDDFE